MNKNTHETWLPVPDFENKYEIISNLKWLIEMSKDTDKKVLTIKYP